MTEDEFFAMGLAKICEALHMAWTGSGESVSDEWRIAAITYLRKRLNNWSPPHAGNGRYDDAYAALVRATIAEQEQPR